MAVVSSETDICNLALQRLGAKSISNLTEDSPAGRACNRVYDHARDSELRAHSWSFARARVSLPAAATPPAFGFLQQYPLPSDYLRILPNALIDDWQIEGRSILTNTAAPLLLVYIKRVTDPNMFDELFVALLVARIAMDISEALTQSNTKRQAAAEGYKLARADARKINAFERTSQKLPTDSWIKVRN